MDKENLQNIFAGETYSAVMKRLSPVIRGFRQIRFWWIAALIALFAAFLGLSLIGAAKNGEVAGLQSALVLGSCSAAALVFAYFAIGESFRDPREVATKVEEHFPTLKQRLLTAISVGQEPGQQMGFLQRRVIKEASDHSRTHRWTDAVPKAQAWCSRIAGAIGVFALVAVLTILASVKPEDPVSRNSVASLDKSQPAAPEVTVLPGDTSVERGNSLVVTARFSENAPFSATMVCTSGEGEGEQRVTMTQNLDDPVLGGFVASVNEPFEYKIVTDDWTSDTYKVDVFEFPTLLRADAELKYPTYTKLQDKQIEDVVRVSAVQGTKLTWSMYLNKPVESAELVSKDGTRIALKSDDAAPNLVRSEIELAKTQRWTLELVDDEGRKNKYPPELLARVLPNKPPSMKLTFARDVSVSPLEELPLGATVRDDFGVQRVGLTFSFADQPPQELVLAEDIDHGEKREVNHLVEFEALGAKPDQLFSYYFWAEDVMGDGETRRVESDMYFAEVRPFEEIFREGQQPPGGEQQQQQQQSQNAQQAEQLAELQKEIINATWTVIRAEREAEVSDEFVTNVTLLKDSQGDALEQLEELAQEIRDAESLVVVDNIRKSMIAAIEELSDSIEGKNARPLNPAIVAEKASYGGLLKLRAREIEVTRQQQQSQSQSASSQQRQQQLDELELKQDENRYETQQQAEETEQQEQQRELRQVLNRLRELAKRQEDLNKQLAQLQSALEQAETEEEREEIERQLKRLREQQQELLRRTDELTERTQQEQNQETMSDATEQLEQTRENVRQASEALEQQDASQALAAGRRAEREFEELRDEFRQKAAGQFNETVRDMRSKAQELDDKEKEIAEDLEKMSEPKERTPGLRGDDQREELAKALDQQKEDLGQLLNQMKDTVEQAEVAEPLLAQKLYDSYRKTQQRQTQQRLDNTNQLLQRGFDEEAQQYEKAVGEGLQKLREELESAAEAVLGDETEALRRALGELEQLNRDLDEEIDREDPAARGGNRTNQNEQPQNDQQEGRRGQPAESGQAGTEQEGQQDAQPGQNGQPREGQQGQDSPQQRAGRQGQNGEESESSENQEGQQSGQQPQGDQQGQQSGQQDQGDQQGQQPGQQGQQPGQGQPSEQQGQPSQGQQPGQQGQGQQGQGQQPGQQGQGQQSVQQNQQPGSQTNSQGGEGGMMSGFAADSPSSSPITGDGFREWSDRLRDVEEMVEDPELRSRAARIRDRAREVRVDLRRHSKAPQWRLVEKMIAQPLRELKRDVQEELLRRSAEKNALVPIDRDPVPVQFTDAVRKYYESLGSGR